MDFGERITSFRFLISHVIYPAGSVTSAWWAEVHIFWEIRSTRSAVWCLVHGFRAETILQ